MASGNICFFRRSAARHSTKKPHLYFSAKDDSLVVAAKVAQLEAPVPQLDLPPGHIRIHQHIAFRRQQRSTRSNNKTVPRAAAA